MTSLPSAPPAASPDRASRQETLVVLLVAAVQFVNILDFVMVMPLGPDFAKALDIPMAHLGYVGGSYTAAAAVAGLLGSFFLERFDRRKALAVCMAGLVAGTAAGALANGMATLLAARVLAGALGGPASSVAVAIVADVVPVARRGRAMATVMSAFSVASVLGVPAGLMMAEHGGWRAPFVGTAALGALITVAAVFMLPPLRSHLDAAKQRTTRPRYLDLFANRLVGPSYLMTALIMVGGFILIPNISAFVQYNLHYPREQLGRLYLVGGVASFLSMRVVGRMVDRLGPALTGSLGCLALAVVTYFGFVNVPQGLSVMLVYVTFMTSTAFRNVSYNTLSSRVPGPSERAQFMSLQSAVQHLAAAGAAMTSAQMLGERADHSLVGMPAVAGTTVVLCLLTPVVMWGLQRALSRRDVRALALPPVAATA